MPQKGIKAFSSSSIVFYKIIVSKNIIQNGLSVRNICHISNNKKMAQSLLKIHCKYIIKLTITFLWTKWIYLVFTSLSKLNKTITCTCSGNYSSLGKRLNIEYQKNRICRSKMLKKKQFIFQHLMHKHGEYRSTIYKLYK